MAESKPVSFRVDQATSDALEQLAAGFPNKQDMLNALMDAYAEKGAKSQVPADIAGHMEALGDYLDGIKAIALNMTRAFSLAKQTAQDKVAAQMQAKDNTIVDLQGKVTELQAELTQVQQDAEKATQQAQAQAQAEIAQAQAEVAQANKQIITLQAQVVELQGQLIAAVQVQKSAEQTTPVTVDVSKPARRKKASSQTQTPTGE